MATPNDGLTHGFQDTACESLQDDFLAGSLKNYIKRKKKNKNKPLKKRKKRKILWICAFFITCLQFSFNIIESLMQLNVFLNLSRKNEEDHHNRDAYCVLATTKVVLDLCAEVKNHK